MVFLMLLAIAFGVSAGLLLIVVGVLEAPWPILLGILILGLLATQRISTESQALHRDITKLNDRVKQAKSSASDSKAITTKLTLQHNAKASSAVVYRGVVYQGEVASLSTEGAIAQSLRYRGISYENSKAANLNPEAQQTHNTDDSQMLPIYNNCRQSADQQLSSDSSNLAEPIISQDAFSSDLSPAPGKTTIVEGTYRGRHWERVVSLPTHDIKPVSPDHFNESSGSVSEANDTDSNTTIVEGTYRGRHWERVVSVSANDPCLMSVNDPSGLNSSESEADNPNASGINTDGIVKNG